MSVQVTVGQLGSPVAAQVTDRAPIISEFQRDMGQQTAEDDGRESSESDSVQTAIPQTADRLQLTQVINDEARESANEEQILSVTSLALMSASNSPKLSHHEFEEAEEEEQAVFLEIDLSNEAASDEMFAVYRKQADEDPQTISGAQMTTDAAKRVSNQKQPANESNPQSRCNGFGEMQPTKITFASRRMKEYFESFRGHKGETLRLYQFFKSTRTELIACLLFTLITSQALIVLRTNLIDGGSQATWPLHPSALRQLQQYQEKAQAGSALLQSQDNSVSNQLSLQGSLISNSDGKPPLDNRLPRAQRSVTVHLAHALVVAFTVASLTQIFGHISGCHLIPSVSLALYVKGHISRVRLASYLAAQLVGSALGVSLLSLLSSSQLSQTDYQTMLLQSRISAPHYYRDETLYSQPIFVPAAHDQLKRVRRDVATTFDAQKLDRDHQTSATAGEQQQQDEQQELREGSETILLSIMEQLELQQQKQQLRLPDGREQEHRKQATTASKQQSQSPGGGSNSATRLTKTALGAAGEQLQQLEFVAQHEQVHQHEAKRIVQPAAMDVEKTITVNVNTFHNNSSASGTAPASGSGWSNLQAGAATSVVGAPRAQFEQAKTATVSSLQTPTPAAATTTTTTSLAENATIAPITIVHETPARPATASSPSPAGSHPMRQWNYSESASELEQASLRRLSDEQQQRQPMLSLFNDRSRVVSSPADGFGGGGGATNAIVDDVERLFVVSSTASPNAPPHTALSRGGSDGGNEQSLLWSSNHQQQHSDSITSQADSLAVTSSRRPKLKRRKRNKLQQQPNATQQTTLDASNLAANEHGPRLSSDHFINLLEFTLPDQIMSSESIRQCIDKQLVAVSAPHSPNPNQTIAGEENQLGRLASNCFHDCISLSNSSQMFIYQFLATLLVVLTYLVNVDPRRIDPGFKSLSIGLSYFVASILTVHSGGFYGNPFHLVFLSWLSSTGEWRSEWFIYLVTPLIAGIFSAISHEYIDFSSLKNRNKQLHLRRSFYSLDNIGQCTQTASNDNQGSDEPHAYLEMCGLRQQGATSEGIARQLSSSSSLESAGVCTSSVLSFNAGSNQTMQVKPPQPQPRNAASSSSDTYSNATVSRNKLARYARPPRALDHHHSQRLNAGASSSCNHPMMMMKQETASLRRSGFDSNFLISSNGAGATNGQISSSLSSASSTSPPPPTATRRQLPPPANGWM